MRHDDSTIDTVPGDARANWIHYLQSQLHLRNRAHLLRRLRQVDSPVGPTITIDGKTYVQFCSNNYLGLANDPEVIAAAQEATARFGTGAGASRLVSGSLAIHHELEAALALSKRTQAALIYPTGYMANLSVLTTFADAGDLIVSDKLNHASLLDAAKFSGAVFRTFPHRHAARAEELLARFEAGHDRRFLVSDSVFSMDGDVADLPSLCAAAERCGALVVIDEAHATGVLGPRGGGLAELQQVEDRITLTIGTLSKTLGSLGGFVAGPRAAIDSLINGARSFIYTTALPPGCAAAALAALRIVQRDPARRQRVMHLATHVKTQLRAMDYNCGDSATPIIPIILGTAQAAVKASQFLADRGLYVPAIRPPTVPPNSARLRLSLMATHSDAQVEQLLEALRALRAELSTQRIT